MGQSTWGQIKNIKLHIVTDIKTINTLPMMMDEDDELAEGMKRKLDAFDLSLNNLESHLKPYLNIPANDIHDKISDPLVKARLDLMVAYSINSLFWAYLSTQGVNPHQHPIRNELKRIRENMGKVKLAEEKKKMARIDTHAAQRFVRNALWQAPPSTSTSTATDETTKDENADTEKEIEPPAPKKVRQNENMTDDVDQPAASTETRKKSKKKKSKKEKKEKKKKKDHD